MKRVLLVDDDPDILTSLEMLLEGEYEVSLAADGASALAAMLTQPFDVIVLDLMMPVLDGAGVLRELRARDVRVPVLLASAARDLRTTARELKAEDFIEKPFDLDLLEAKLASLANTGTPLMSA
jgi:DNA-binding response OmpR family regulator